MTTKNLTVADLQALEELSVMVSESSAKVAEQLAVNMQAGIIKMKNGPDALRDFATAIRVLMASEFSVGSVH
jgi:hypothetical protein